jgi:hypothetical protein
VRLARSLAVIVLTPMVPPRLPVAAGYPPPTKTCIALTELLSGPVLEVPWPRRPGERDFERVHGGEHARLVAAAPVTLRTSRACKDSLRAPARHFPSDGGRRLSALTGVRWIVAPRPVDDDRDTGWRRCTVRSRRHGKATAP